MEKLFIIFTLVLTSSFLFKKNLKTQLETKTENSAFNILDSLIKYNNVDSLLIIDDSSQTYLFIGKANTKSFATYIEPNKMLIFFQKLNDKEWIASDTIFDELDFSRLDRIDINGDQIKDIKVSWFSGSAGNSLNKVFLFDNFSSSFKHNKYYDLPNIEYDQQNKFVKSWWFAGVVHCQEKSKYKITGDSLTLESHIIYCPDEKTNGRKASLEISELQPNNTFNTIIKRGNSNRLWRIFEKSCWEI